MFLKKYFKKPRFVIFILMSLLILQGMFTSVQTFAAATVNIDPYTTYQTIEGWGASICWWGNQIGGWSENNRNNLIEKIISPVDGLGYNIFRYNIGGGDAPGHNHMRAYGNIEGYEPSSGVWNWNADATQRAVLQKLLERGKYYGQDMIAEAFSNSPPYWMTKSGCASGNTDGSNNLKDDCYDDFAEYLTEVVKHFRDSWGITFRTLEPMNEPNVNWWKANGGQEGCCFTFSVQPKIIQEVGSRLKSKGLTGTTVSSADENSIDTAVSGLKTYDDATLSYITQVNTHSYSGSQRSALFDLAKSKGKKVWQSESGPLSFTGEMMDSNIMMSQRIVKDLKEMKADAWIDWQIIDTGNWGSIYVNNTAQTFTLTKKFYMHSNYSRFIKPGYTIIGADNETTVAALSSDKKRLVIVATNASKTNTDNFTFNLSKFSNINSNVEVYRTSESLDLAKSNITANSRSISDTLPAYSINTYVVSLGDNAIATQAVSTSSEPAGGTVFYKLINENSGKALDVADSSLIDGAGIIQQSDNGSESQKWYFTDNGDGYKRIVNLHSQKVLDVSEGSAEDGGNIIQWADNNSLNQQWSLTDNGNGYYKIINRKSSKLLDVSGESLSDGGSIIQYKDTNGKNQHWKLVAVGSATPTVSSSSGCDLNGDGAINMSDVIILASSFNTVKGDARYVESRDLNRDGAINMSDVMIVAAKFNTLAVANTPKPTQTPLVSKSPSPLPSGTTGRITYTLNKASNPTADQLSAYSAITSAMDQAISYYNTYTNIVKHLSVYYEPSVATADANYNGTLRFGQKAYMNNITAMHEIAHAVGIGTTSNYSALIKNGIFTGVNATNQLRAITGNQTDVLKGDSQHFWPYGLNYTSEVKSNDDLVNHCKIVVAIRKDMGF